MSVFRERLSVLANISQVVGTLIAVVPLAASGTAWLYEETKVARSNTQAERPPGHVTTAGPARAPSYGGTPPVIPDSIGTPVVPREIGTPVIPDSIGTPVVPREIGTPAVVVHIGRALASN